MGNTQKANREAAEQDAQQAKEERSILMSELSAVRANLDELRSEIRYLRSQSVPQNGIALSEVEEPVDLT